MIHYLIIHCSTLLNFWINIIQKEKRIELSPSNWQLLCDVHVS